MEGVKHGLRDVLLGASFRSPTKPVELLEGDLDLPIEAEGGEDGPQPQTVVEEVAADAEDDDLGGAEAGLFGGSCEGAVEALRGT